MFLEVLARKQAELNLRRTRISAPAGGIVGKFLAGGRIC